MAGEITHYRTGEKFTLCGLVLKDVLWTFFFSRTTCEECLELHKEGFE